METKVFPNAATIAHLFRWHANPHNPSSRLSALHVSNELFHDCKYLAHWRQKRFQHIVNQPLVTRSISFVLTINVAKCSRQIFQNVCQVCAVTRGEKRGLPLLPSPFEVFNVH